MSCADERRSARAAAVETGHGGKTAIDVWRHGVRGVTLQRGGKKNPEALIFFYFDPLPRCFYIAGVCVRVCQVETADLFARALIFSSDSTKTGGEQKLMGEGRRGERQSSICSLPVTGGQLKAGRLTAADQTATQRGSAGSD